VNKTSTGQLSLGYRSWESAPPIAAAVADVAVGFAGEVHVAKGMIFMNGLLSIILAIGIESIDRENI
jgi:hypothetical protein